MGLENMFTPRGIRKYWELSPLVSILSVAVVGCSSFMIYSLATKSDINIIKTKGAVPRFERVDPEKAQKIVTLHSEYITREDPEVEKLRRQLGSYRY